MTEPSTWPDAKLYVMESEENLVPYQTQNGFEIQRSDYGERAVITTNEDRIEFFKSLLNLYPGPFFITIVVQEPTGDFKKPGRYYSARGKTRLQVDFFLDHFHDYICHEGFIHVWVTCESTNGIVVYDQHDMFFVYQRAAEATAMLKDRNYKDSIQFIEFPHAHRTREDINPGSEEILKFEPWWYGQLEISDVRDPDRKSLKNYWLRFRTWRAIRRQKKKRRE